MTTWLPARDRATPPLAWAGLALGFLIVAPALALPLFPADVAWLNAARVPIPHPALARMCLAALHLLICAGLAAAQRKDAQLATLALGLASPVAYRAVTWVALVLPLGGLLLVMTGWLAHRLGAGRGGTALALAFGGMALAASLATASTGVLLMFVFYAAWLGLAYVLPNFFNPRLARIHHRIPRALLALVLPALVLCGGLNTLGWLRGYALASSPLRALDQLGPESRILVLNAPMGLAIPNTPGDSSIFGEQLLPAAPNVQLGRMIEGEVGAPGSLNGFTANYAGVPAFNKAQALQHIFASSDVILAGYGKPGEFASANVGGAAKPGAGYAASFELNGDSIRLIEAKACAKPNGEVWATLTAQIARLQNPNSKFFRHALLNGEQVAVNDAALLGGLVELGSIPPGSTLRDASLFASLKGAATAVRIGLYNWQTGERWKAIRPDGGAFEENAVVTPIQTGGPCP